MRIVTLDDLRDKTPELLELVQAGETLDVKDGERFVATFGPPRPEPVQGATFEERYEELIRRGTIKRGTRRPQRDLWETDPPKLEGDKPLSQMVIEDREDRC